MAKSKGKSGKAAKAARRKEKVGVLERVTTLLMMVFLLSLGAQQVLAVTTG